MVGVGTRGIYLLERAQECPNTEIRVICDLYDSNLKRAADKSFNKKAQLMGVDTGFPDWLRLIPR